MQNGRKPNAEKERDDNNNIRKNTLTNATVLSSSEKRKKSCTRLFIATYTVWRTSMMKKETRRNAANFVQATGRLCK